MYYGRSKRWHWRAAQPTDFPCNRATLRAVIQLVERERKTYIELGFTTFDMLVNATKTRPGEGIVNSVCERRWTNVVNDTHAKDDGGVVQVTV